MAKLAIIVLIATLAITTHVVFSQPVALKAQPIKFQNNYLNFEPPGLFDFLKWRWNALRDGHPKSAQIPTPIVTADLAFIHANSQAGSLMQPAVTWVGHATALVQFAGLTVLTDPIFSERASPLSLVGPKRAQPPGIALKDLPHIDVVLISHNHYDHLDEASVRALASQAGGAPLFVVPSGVKTWFTDLRITNVVELAWWQTHRMQSSSGPVEIVLTPVQHWSGRSLTDRMDTLWGGFAVFTKDFHFFHVGDTSYSRDFQDIATRFADRQPAHGFDLVLIPIGAYAPRWFMKDQHVDPEEAVQIHKDLRARQSVAYHWGTFSLSNEALDDPPIALAAALQAQGIPATAFSAIPIGQTLKLAARAER
ncbi:MAG: MBL fold metallo-hydrolase [Burkholderiales bacterium]|nr:MBL fold metallo-hydrolase [Burkholderiales bacterium]